MDQHVVKLVALGFAEEQAQQVVDFLGDRVYAGNDGHKIQRGVRSKKVRGTEVG